MKHQLVKWNSVRCKAIDGDLVPLRVPKIVDMRYCGTLLPRILSMHPKKPISFEMAIRMLAEKQDEAFDAGRFGDQPGQYGWYCLNFVDWISSQGYHIELSGDEFESYALSDKVV